MVRDKYKKPQCHLKICDKLKIIALMKNRLKFQCVILVANQALIQKNFQKNLEVSKKYLIRVIFFD